MNVTHWICVGCRRRWPTTARICVPCVQTAKAAAKQTEVTESFGAVIQFNARSFSESVRAISERVQEHAAGRLG